MSDTRPEDRSGPTMKHTPDDIPTPGPRTSDGDWARPDFEAALSLYVGGELSDVDRRRVDRWIEDHPGDLSALRAARASQALLVEHARRAKERSERQGHESLWANLRSELADANLFAPETSAEVAHLAPVSGTPVLSGPGSSDHRSPGRSWFSPRLLSVAAAVTICAGLAGWALRDAGGGSEANPLSGNAAPESGAAMPEIAATSPATGGASAPRVASGMEDRSFAEAARSRGRVRQRLRPAGPDAIHLIDQVKKNPTYLGFPLPEHGGHAGPQLTGGQ